MLRPLSRFALMVRPSLNQVYAASSPQLALAELDILSSGVLAGRCHDTGQTTIADVAYLEFSVASLSETDLRWIASLSSALALFEISDGLLKPVPLPHVDVLDPDLLTIPKYRGKTNELFTKLLLNVALFSRDTADEASSRPLRVLDPMCGRGTTLSQALTYGFDATGLEIDARACDAYTEFVATWLKRKRLKHKVHEANKRRSPGGAPKRTVIEFAVSKALFRGGDHLSLTIINADTLRALELCPKHSFDLVVTDMPYGVQHGTRDAGGTLSRAPAELLRAALPVWAELLRPGGTVALAWNTRVASRERMREAFAGTGLELLNSEPYGRFKHWVDQAITRDILVGRRPRHTGG